MTTDEAAELMRVTVHQIARYATNGKIPGWKTPGGSWRFSRRALLSLLDSPVNE